MISYYDPFNVEEEEDFLATEQERTEKEVTSFLQRLRDDVYDNNDDHRHKEGTGGPTPPPQSPSHPLLQVPSLPVLDFALTESQLRRIVDAFQEGATATSSRCYPLLSFRHWGLGNYGCAVLAGHHQDGLSKNQIRHLSLASCGLTAPGLCHLLSLPNLQTLDVRRNNFRCSHPYPVSTVFATLVPHLTNLRSLNVSGTGLTVESVRSLLEAVTINTSLQSVDVSDNCVDHGTSFDQLLVRLEPQIHRLVRHNTTVRTFLFVTPDGSVRTSPSYSTCIDYNEPSSVSVLRRIVRSLQATRQTQLSSLGSLSVLPLVDTDTTGSTIRNRYVECVQAVRTIHYLLSSNGVFGSSEHRTKTIRSIVRYNDDRHDDNTIGSITSSYCTIMGTKINNRHFQQQQPQLQQHYQSRHPIPHDHHHVQAMISASILYHWIHETLPVLLDCHGRRLGAVDQSIYERQRPANRHSRLRQQGGKQLNSSWTGSSSSTTTSMPPPATLKQPKLFIPAAS